MIDREDQLYCRYDVLHQPSNDSTRKHFTLKSHTSATSDMIDKMDHLFIRYKCLLSSGGSVAKFVLLAIDKLVG